MINNYFGAITGSIDRMREKYVFLKKNSWYIQKKLNFLLKFTFFPREVFFFFGKVI